MIWIELTCGNFIGIMILIQFAINLIYFMFIVKKTTKESFESSWKDVSTISILRWLICYFY